MLISRTIYIENEDVNLDKDALETAPTQSACLRASRVVIYLDTIVGKLLPKNKFEF